MVMTYDRARGTRRAGKVAPEALDDIDRALAMHLALTLTGSHGNLDDSMGAEQFPVDVELRARWPAGSAAPATTSRPNRRAGHQRS
jgi:hypothetical protein